MADFNLDLSALPADRSTFDPSAALRIFGGHLAAIPSGDVERPMRPVEEMVTDASRLARAYRLDLSRFEPFGAVLPLPSPEVIDLLCQTVLWLSKSETEDDAIAAEHEEALTLRGDIIAHARQTWKPGTAVRRTLAAFEEPRNRAALSTQLTELANLYEVHAADLAGKRVTLDPQALVEARRIAARFFGDPRSLNGGQVQTARAVTLLRQMTRYVQAAAALVFFDEPERLADYPVPALGIGRPRSRRSKPAPAPTPAPASSAANG